MGWTSFEGRTIDEEKILSFYSQIKEERRYWFDKCLSYMNFYYTINVTLFTGFFLVNNFEKVQKMMIIMPALSFLICVYAKKINRICHKQFLENTVIMIKLEYLLGMYNKVKTEPDVTKEIPFKNDKYIGIERHYRNMIEFETSDEYVENELREKKRSYKYNTNILNYMMLMSVILVAYGILTNGILDNLTCLLEMLKKLKMPENILSICRFFI